MLMRRLLIVVAVLLGGAVAGVPSPAEAQVKTAKPPVDLKTLKGKLEQRANRWFTVRKTIVVECWVCRGNGVFNGAQCSQCGGKTWAYSEEKTKKVFQEYRSPAWWRQPNATDLVIKAYLDLKAGRLPGFVLKSAGQVRGELIDDTHGIVSAAESTAGGTVTMSSQWILVTDPPNKSEWYLWTEGIDGPWPDRAEPPSDAAEVDASPPPAAKPAEPEAKPAPAPSARSTTALSVPLSAPISAPQLPFDPADSAGLFVGIRSFTDGNDAASNTLSDVPYGVDDAIDLAYTFAIDLKLIHPDKVLLSLGGEAQKEESKTRLEALLKAGAKREAAVYTSLLRQVPLTCRQAGENGLLVISFATHGLHTGGDDWLLAQDSLYGQTATAVPVNLLADATAETKAPRRILLFDACRERVATGRSVADENSKLSSTIAERLGQHRGTFTLFAAQLGGYSYDDNIRKNGVFTGALLDALHGDAAPDKQGLITLGSVAMCVNAKVKAWIRVNRVGEALPADIERSAGMDMDDMPLAQHRATPAPAAH